MQIFTCRYMYNVKYAHTHTLQHCTHTYATHMSGQSTAEKDEQTKQLEEQMRSLEGRRQQLEQQQVSILKQLRSLQTMEKQFQEAVKIQQGQLGAVVKLVLRKRYDSISNIIISNWTLNFLSEEI